MLKMLSLIGGISALALAGTAYAGEPLKLTDKQMGFVTAGAGDFNFRNNDFNFTKNLTSTSNNNVNFRANSQVLDAFEKLALIDVQSHVTGTSASLGFDNEAIGKNSNVQGTFSQQTVAGQGSSQAGLFVSAANGRGR
jgi:hypothetical protein